MNQRIYGDDLTNNEHPFSKEMGNLVRESKKIDDILNKSQEPKNVTVTQNIPQLKQE
jgi:hypothetical protein